MSFRELRIMSAGSSRRGSRFGNISSICTPSSFPLSISYGARRHPVRAPITARGRSSDRARHRRFMAGYLLFITCARVSPARIFFRR